MFQNQKVWALISHAPHPKIPTNQLLSLLPGQISIFPSEIKTLEIFTNRKQNKTITFDGCYCIHSFTHSFSSFLLKNTLYKNHPRHGVKWSEVKVTQWCPTLCDPMDWILQARILQWAAAPFSRGSSSQSRNQTQVSPSQVDSLSAEPQGKLPAC